MTRFLLLPFALVLLAACQSRTSVDLIVHHARVYTADDSFSVAEALAVQGGQLVAVGTDADIMDAYEAAQTYDAGGKALYPGFIDAHCHFLRYGLSLRNVDLTGTESFNEVIANVMEGRQRYPDAAWILGRGWDQNDWPTQEYPTRDTLDQLFPDTPLLLTRIDGHAALANGRALELAGITAETKVEGGSVELENGRLTGVLIDNAVTLVEDVVPPPSREMLTQALLEAQQNCFAVGLTTVDDAGLTKHEVTLIDSLHRAGALKMRVYAMLTPDEATRAYYFENGPYQTERLTARAFKVYADGALGSRGAILMNPYHDRPGHRGFLLSAPEVFETLADSIYAAGFQMNTHCIGDSANRLILQLYAQTLGGANDRRWRIEHAQVVADNDVPLFGEYDIIPSVQPTHATSDMYWAEERLGTERVQTAYAYRDMLEAYGMLALGSDFPVEDINPLYGFHAAVFRQDGKDWPEGGFQPENAISRQEALLGMTRWAAYSNFEEEQKGSLKAGKVADFVILEQDLMEAPATELRNVRVVRTYLNGELVYEAK
ncbi:hypothetical protein SAMN05421823_10858 [Catalinimonas alkaloidigena]|uniref:Amidohydrolase 3 domain-containing protein n=1 Tax=Catalinimonas alkaloidigena TaxID=1075417 RepID=A0A1G9MQJ6_9BACT|nr:amidohydrolase [Catalinimonas alkaloidigena]SDL76528.1 hypothetical protein SAMN05421823_10858 [Catalinimonas alkaloidigena]